MYHLEQRCVQDRCIHKSMCLGIHYVSEGNASWATGLKSALLVLQGFIPAFSHRVMCARRSDSQTHMSNRRVRLSNARTTCERGTCKRCADCSVVDDAF